MPDPVLFLQWKAKVGIEERSGRGKGLVPFPKKLSPSSRKFESKLDGQKMAEGWRRFFAAVTLVPGFRCGLAVVVEILHSTCLRAIHVYKSYSGEA